MAPKTSSPADDRSSVAATLRERFDRKTATIAVVGLGYVGLPLVRAVHNAGFPTIGFDTDTTKISTLRQGGSYLHHLGEELARTLAASERFEATSSPKSLAA
ncbi:MAG: NAD(P)-binding domain-containing protein, partial [Planctomycetota bacterium]|nr:NAD(P)-binding domain-containing protein [Planctomycetota bacterium]